MNIAVIGVGGVGGYFGGKLCRAAKTSGDVVHFIARGMHLEAISEHGLLVKTAAGDEQLCRPASASDKIEGLGAVDLALICVKSYDLDAVMTRLAQVITLRTIVIPLLNGVDVYERIRRVSREAIVCPACVFIGTHIESPGVVTQNGGPCKILLGPDPLSPGPAPTALTALLTRAQIKFEWFDDVTPEIWTKFIFIAAFGLVTAAFDKTLGQVMAAPELSGRVRAVMAEIAALAVASGIGLPDTIVAESFFKGNDYQPGTKTSLQRDVESKSGTDERDLFGGAIIRMGRALHVDTPATSDLCEVLERRKPSPAIRG